MNCVQLLCDLVKYPSVTPQECGIYDFLKDFFKSADFEILQQENAQKDGVVKNIFFYTKNYASAKNRLCFAGHIDVVPVGENWSKEPFCGEILDYVALDSESSESKSEKIIFGRGTQDMKSGVAAFCVAVKKFLDSENLDSKNFAISILLTSDEEGEGTFGTRKMLELLEQKNLLPTCAIVAEPTASKRTGDCVKIGRRGSINGVIRIFGKQGHAAYPQNCVNPVELLGARLGELAGKNLDNGDENFEPSKLVITDIRGGMEVVNVTPAELKIMFNVRNNPKTTLQNVEDYVRGVLSGLDFELSVRQTSLGFITDSENFLVRALAKSVQSVCGIKPDLSTSGGTSDARFLGAREIAVVEIGVPNDRIHAVNECVKVSDVQELERIFEHFLSNFES